MVVEWNLPSGNVKISELENDHRNSGFTVFHSFCMFTRG